MTIQDYVERAAARLDTIAPGWEDHIDEGCLDLSSCTDCVLGQLFGSWTKGLQKLGVVNGYIVDFKRMSDEYGFAFAGNRQYQDAWIEAICDRRLKIQHPQTEADLVL